MCSTRTLKPHTLGGQAVIEGVMMRSPGWWSLAVRRPDGTIHTESHQTGRYAKRRPLLGAALVRGVAALVEAMSIGMRALSISARVSSGEEEGKLTKKEMAISISIALVFFVVLFKVLPALLSGGRDKPSGVEAFVPNLLEGLIRIGIFLAYIIGISFIPDIRRVFQYHGAEHKVIAAHESGAPLTKDAARPFSTVHVRCGTDFLFLLMILSVVVYSLLPRPNLVFLIVSRIVLLPVVAAVSYEVLRIAARHERNPIVRLVTFPGRLLQRVTTREPADDQLEVAIAALGELMVREGVVDDEQAEPREPADRGDAEPPDGVDNP